ncbi:hypothetical protein [Mucilaginibacter ginkgonis]|uniref:Carboxypeptidase-like protein n=1 Tax=Mucilaginibacter ginkgonis TaxID=2682091 RepID=A0A6I4I3S1_9SPHI|nr:hypothetical protein [Mucilaginibacter ginkgonis]QQL48706.1 hypothetical protein GO620_011000 [Mucilaginibacter ginkgonis]
MRIFIILGWSLVAILLNSRQTTYISGKVIDEHLQQFTGAKITNKTSNIIRFANANGLYSIPANLGDSLVFSFRGTAAETRIVKVFTRPTNVLLMNKTVNDLGAVWTKKQWLKAEKEVDKKYRSLLDKARSRGVWAY